MWKLTILILLFCYNFGYSQVLKNVPLNLNAGGAVYDVVYDNYLNAYIIVGDFTSVNGQARNNIAFINANNFSLISTATQPLPIVNGVIRTVEIHKKESETTCCPVATSQGIYSIFIGGEFTTVNGFPRVAVARLGVIFYNNPSVGQSYGLMNWNAQIDDGGGPWQWVNDMVVVDDVLTIVGEFYINEPTYDATNVYMNLASFSVGNSATNSALEIDDQGSIFYPTYEIYHIDYFDGNYYFNEASGVGIQKFNVTDGISSFGITYTAWSLNIKKEGLNSIMSYQPGYSAQDQLIYDFNGNVIDFFSPGHLSLGYAESYKDYYYIASRYSGTQYENHLNTYLSPNHDLIQTSVFQSSDASYFYDLNETFKKRIFRNNDKLFLSGDFITSVDGQSRTGLAVFCLEPRDAQPFTQLEEDICTGNIITYAIPEVEFADGYKWSYTGTGAQIRLPGPIGFQSLNAPVHFNNLNAHTVEIEFLSGVTSGELTVEPYTLCNSTTDYILAQGQSINLSIIPPPEISLIDSLAFTCIADTLLIEVQTLELGLSFSWNEGLDATVIATQQQLELIDTSVTAANYFYVVATEPVNNCSSRDSIFVYFDTLAAQLNQGMIQTNPTVFNCSTDSMEIFIDVAGADVLWRLSSDSVAQIPNPFFIYSNDSTSFEAEATYISNGCVASQSYLLVEDLTFLVGEVAGYPNLSSVVILDTINCNTTELILDALLVGSSDINDSISWIIDGVHLGDQLVLTANDSTGLSVLNTKTYLLRTFKENSQCTFDYNVTIYFDLQAPFVPTMNTTPSINCSADSVVLIHPLNGSTQVAEGWLDTFGVSTQNDSIWVSQVGEYYYEVMNIINGCATYDTVNVTQTNELLLSSSADTLVCEGDALTLFTSPINNASPTNYLWSNGATQSSTSLLIENDEQLTVIATNQDGCVGYDTINVTMNPPVYVEFSSFSACTPGSSGLFVDSISGGQGGYTYEIDGVGTNSSGSFSGLSYGTYSVDITDNLGCLFSFEVEIDPLAQGPELQFLVPTYNIIGDTIAAINITNFTGFDYVEWEVPGITDVIDVNDTLLIFSLDEEGAYDIALIGYIDTCSYRTEKTVYFNLTKPEFGFGQDTLGILSLTLYPNPTTGSFIVAGEFGVEQNYSMLVTNMNGQPLTGMASNGYSKTFEEQFEFPFGVSTGSYIVHIVSDYDARKLTVVYQ